MSSARITFLGAVGEVTGSSYLIESGRSKVLVDCGMHQGLDADRKNMEPFSFSPSDLDAVILTHAHIDHSGRLPLLVRQGFKGDIWATDPTIDLANILLRDTVRLMAEEAEWKNKKNLRRGLKPIKPIYDEKDVEDTLRRFRYANYDDRVSAADDVSVRFRDSGHIVGASIIELWVGDDPLKIVFSGDIGPENTVIEKPPTVIEEADYVIIESTYGDRSHRSLEDTRTEFRAEMQRALTDGGKILIPTFVVDRAQRVLYELLLLQRSGSVPKMPPIYFDSPMGAKTTQIYDKYMNLFSREMQDMARSGQNPFSPDGLIFTSSVAESRAINEVDHAIVLAGSGMCSGGRIIHHLKHSLWDSRCNVFFVGYQARGTLGRRLVDGEKSLRIAGEDITVGARLHTIGGFSAHGDRSDLLSWASHFDRGTSFFVTHGEPNSSQSLASGLRELGYGATTPSAGMSYELRDKGTALDPCSVVAVSKQFTDRETVLSLLNEISTETESLREALESMEDYRSLLPLLESSRLILRTAKNLK